MIYIVYILIFVTILWDGILYVNMGARFHGNAFREFSRNLVFVFMLALALLFLGAGTYNSVPFFIISFATPLYLRIRRDFKKMISLQAQKREPCLLSDALGVIIIWLYSIVASSFFLRLVTRTIFDWNADLLELLMTASISSAVVLARIFNITRQISAQGMGFNLGLAFPRKAVLKKIFAPALLGMGYAFMAAFLALRRPVTPQTPLGDILKETQSPLVIGLFIFLALFMAPIIEEIIFRGYFFSVLKRLKGTVFAVAFVALIFALLHVGQYWGDWLAIVVVAFLGLTLTVLRAVSGSTWASISAHFSYNVGVTILPMLLLALANPSYMHYQIHYESLSLDEKEKYLHESIAKQPYLADAYNDLAWIYCKKDKNLEEALKWVNLALSYDENNRAYLDTKACLLSQMGRKEQADAIWQKLKEQSFQKGRHRYRAER